MNRPWFVVAFCLFAVFVAGSVSGQDAAGTKVKVRFRTLGWDLSVAGLHYEQQKKDADITVESNVRSDFFDYAGPAELAIYRLKADPAGKSVHVQAAAVDLSHAGAWPLLIFFADPKDAEHPRVEAVPDDLESFPAGSFSFVNYLATDAVVKLGGDELTLKPAERKMVKPVPPTGQTTLFAQVSYPVEEQNKLAYSSNWAFQPASRTLVILCRSEESGSQVIVRRVVENTGVLVQKPGKSGAH